MMPETKKHQEEEKKIKISLKELPKPVQKPQPQVKETKQVLTEPITQLAPPMIKGSQLKELSKKEPIKYKPKTEEKTPKLNPTPQEFQIEKPKAQEKPLSEVKAQDLLPMLEESKKTQKQENKEVKKEKTSMNWLYEDKSNEEDPLDKKDQTDSTSLGKNIKELYGSTFGELSKAQQEYILDNQEIMRRITQQVLTRQAAVSNLKGLNVQKMNVIEFYLHPNGDMSDFKFLQKSGYFILDEITKVTIDYAYSKYPRPKEKTLIRYNVFYDLRSY